MFVIENRHGSFVFPEYIDGLLEELVTGIKFLAEFIARIIAVFTDNKHRVHRQLLAAATQRLGNGLVDGKPKLLRAPPRQVALGELVNVCRHHVKGRVMPLAINGITHEKPRAHVPGMRMIAPLGGDDGQSLARGVLREGAGSSGKTDSNRAEESASIHELNTVTDLGAQCTGELVAGKSS